MQQNILSQMPASGSQQDVAANRPANSSRDPETGRSRFDEVSRAQEKRLEQQRLEQQRADQRRMEEKRADRQAQSDRLEEKREQRRAQAADDRKADESRNDNRAADKSNDKTAERADKPGKNSDKADDAATNKAGEANKGSGKKDEAESSKGQRDTAATETSAAGSENELLDAEAMAPVTFAMLQTMTGGAPAQSGEGVVAVNAGMTGRSALQGLLNGQPGQPGAQLTDLLSANVNTETSRPIDPSTLLSAPKFATSLEQAAGQTLQPGKLTAEGAVPLRSYATSVDVPVGQAEWGDKVMGKLSFLTAANMQEAEIHLTPPDMGPMEVKVRMQNEQANITVHSANPVVREQLEQNSHRLREMLGDQGVELGQFDVADQSRQEPGEQGDGPGEGGSGQNNGAVAEAGEEEEVVRSGDLDLAWSGEVDTFV
ncbi:MAG: flagellar hook-length control protein FliK [Alteromonadaceae bacterium]|nr:flagellar hook-length control protein FliK [Alteromonadaceae bacterium]